MRKLAFKNIEVGSLFKCNKTLYKKRSSRTAELINMVGRVFYFGQNDICETTEQRVTTKNNFVRCVIYDIQQFCRDIDQWYEKHYLIPALKSHLEKWHESETIDVAIKQCFFIKDSN
jgi:hypothetical protein